MLEVVKKNPTLYGQLLASTNEKQQKGRHGMFACFQEAAKMVHDGLKVKDGVEALKQRFTVYKVTSANLRKQEQLLKQFVNYCRQYKENDFEFIDGWRNIKWPLLPETQLTGRTPWVVANTSGYYGYVFTEKAIDWKNELRFPLYQKWLVDNSINCSPSELQVGTYCLEKESFEFVNFSVSQLKSAISEASSLIVDVYNAYKN